MDRASGLTRLPVRSRQLVGEGGRQRIELTVYCPFRQRSTELEDCEECSAFVGTRTDLDATWHEVACHRLERAADEPHPAEMLARASLERTPISRLMSRHTICVPPELPLLDVAAMLARHAIGAVPVVDPQFRPLGIVTRTDLVRQGFDLGSNQGAETTLPCPARRGDVNATASDAMSSPAISLGARDSLFLAAKLMSDHAIRRVVITDREGHVVGIVCSSDVLRWLTRK